MNRGRARTGPTCRPRTAAAPSASSWAEGAECESVLPKLSLASDTHAPVVRGLGSVDLLYQVAYGVHVGLARGLALVAEGPVQGLGVDFGQGLSELDEADGIAVPLRGVRLALEDGDGGGDARVLEPLLHLGLDDGDDAEVAQEELLEPEAVLGVQPADAGDESQVSAGLEQAGGVGEEVGVYVRPLQTASSAPATRCGTARRSWTCPRCR